MPSRCPVLSRHWVNGYIYIYIWDTLSQGSWPCGGDREETNKQQREPQQMPGAVEKLPRRSIAEGFAGQVCTVWTERSSPGDSILQNSESWPHEVGEGLPAERLTAISCYPLAPPPFPMETSSIVLRVGSPSRQCLTPQSCRGTQAEEKPAPTCHHHLLSPYSCHILSLSLKPRNFFSTLHAVFDVCNVICWCTPI